jgi:serine/threonine protein kinase
MNQELSANTTLSHYRIVSKIGAGGLGEIYLAEDTRLKRKVALNVATSVGRSCIHSAAQRLWNSCDVCATLRDEKQSADWPVN